MAVLDPIKVIITNYPQGRVEEMEVENNPEDESAGMRKMPFSNELYIEQDDFMENPPKGYFRLSPGGMVRLKAAYIIKCEEVVKDSNNNIIELHCTYIPESRSGSDTSGLKVKGTIHWVSANHALKAEVRMYDKLFTDSEPTNHEDRDYLEFFNPDSLKVIEKAYVEPSLKDTQAGTQVQFMRKGYFTVDRDSTPEKLIFNLTVDLKSSYKK